jgi:hypothetical protein
MALSRKDKFVYKRIANGLYKAMVASSIAMRDKYPGEKYHSDYGKLALKTRPHWEQVNETQFAFKGNIAINIDKNDSVLSIIKSVFVAEVRYVYEPDGDVDRYLEICEYGKSILDKK